jgi:hypothetical protein
MKKANCPECGEVEVGDYYIDDRERSIYPIIYTKTKEDAFKEWQDMTGEEDIKIDELEITKETHSLSHVSDEDDIIDEHVLIGKFKCWVIE